MRLQLLDRGQIRRRVDSLGLDDQRGAQQILGLVVTAEPVGDDREVVESFEIDLGRERPAQPVVGLFGRPGVEGDKGVPAPLVR